MSSSMRTILLDIARMSRGGIVGFVGIGRLHDGRAPQVPGPDGRSQNNPLSALSRWKIFDNLRRSLVPAALMSLFLLGWTALASIGFWTLSVLAVFFMSPVLTSLVDLFRKPDDMRSSSIWPTAHVDRATLTQTLLTLVCLPYEAFFSVERHVRTAGRIWLTVLACWNGVPSTGLDQRNQNGPGRRLPLDVDQGRSSPWSRPSI